MPRSARAHGLSRRHRFTARGSFGPVLRSPKRIRGDAMIIHFLRTPGTVSRLGIALTRRLVPSSVARSRVKRVLREAFRHHPVKNAGLDCVVALRARFERDQLAALRVEAGRLFDRLHAEAR
jgi:ribonuclease P protein component